MIDPAWTFFTRCWPLGLHALAAGIALAASVLWPATGASAALVPLGWASRDQAFAWMDRHDARLIAVKGENRRLIVSVPSLASALSALAHGHFPVAFDAAGCRPPIQKGPRGDQS